MPESDKQAAGSVGAEGPRFAHLLALAIQTGWIALLALPMLSGQFLAGPASDQYAVGYAYRTWGAEQWRATGDVPLWNPTLFGGLPYVAAQHGDIYYPTAWLRLVLPTDVAMNLGFVVHYVLAGFFLYLLLKRLGVVWSAAVAGGLVYQLSGVVGSYVQPGHDGKLFVTALLPLALYGLVLGIRERRLEGHGILALAVGLALLSPQYQMTYYMLIAAGLFALYLAFFDPSGLTRVEGVRQLALALAAIGVGFGIAMIQILPFFKYIPYSPRAEEGRGYAWSTSYAIPWQHVPEFVLARFAGQVSGGQDLYWGPNPLKLHSEYLGLPAVALAVLGARSGRRRLVWWCAATGTLFLLISLGGSTPFYRAWYAFMPYVKQTRAPGMAFYVVSLVVACLAALGIERLKAGEGKGFGRIGAVTGTVIALLGLSGAVGGVARMLALGIDPSGVFHSPAEQVLRAQDGIRWGATLSGVALLLAGAIAWAWQRGRLPARVGVGLLVLVVSADLWRNVRPFWTYSDITALYAEDPVTRYLGSQPPPFRVWDVGGGSFAQGAYPGSVLMAHGISQVLGHHSNEIRYFDDLLNRWGGWSHLASPTLWDLLAIRYILLPAGMSESVPGYHRVLGGQRVASGARVDVLERDAPVRYGRVVPAAAEVPDSLAIRVIVTTRFSPDRLVLVAPGSGLDIDPPDSLPEPLDARVLFEEWRPGFMRLRVAPAVARDAYLVVAENWYPGWRAAADGRELTVARGNGSLITVALPANTSAVELRFESPDSERGYQISLASLVLAAGALGGGALRRRVRG